MAKPISSGKSQELESIAVSRVQAIRADDDETGTTIHHDVISALAEHAYSMGQPDLCFELQSMLLNKPRPNQS